MRRLILLLAVLLYAVSSNAQADYIYRINEQNGKTITTCKGQLTSSKFNASNDNNGYSDNENYTVTFNSGSGDPLKVNFYYIGFDASGADKLEVFDGPSTSSPKLVTLSGGKSMYPGVYTSTGTYLTFRFTSDGSVSDGDGFRAFLGCPIKACGKNPPASDECATATHICNLDGYCGTTSGWYTRGNENFDWAAFNCGTIQNNSWLSFNASATTATFEITSSNCSNSKQGIQAMVFETTDCKSFTGKSNCIDNGIGKFILSASGLTIGSKYYIMVDGYSGNDCDYVIKALTGVQTVSITPVPNSNIFCAGSPLVLQANVTGAGPFTYNWSPQPISGQGTKTATYTAQAIQYSCTITGACGAVITATYTPIINAVPVVKVVSGADTICAGGAGTTLTASSTAGTATLIYSNNTAASIPELFGVKLTSTITVSGYAGIVKSQLKSVTVNITHPSVKELSISLKSPSGTTINLSANNGGTGKDYKNTVFAYTGPSIKTGTAPFTGTYTPEESLTLLDASVVNGTWSLIVADNALFQSGSLTSWFLTFDNGLTYTWSPTTGLSPTTGAVVNANPTVTTTYTVTGTDKAGCSGTASTKVVVIPGTSAPVVKTPVTYCLGDVASPLSATGTGLLWYTTATGGIGSTTAPTPSTAVAGTTLYYVSQLTARCESPRAKITVIVNPKDSASFTYPNSTYCKTGATAIPTITGIKGGTFSVAPSGLSVDPITGVITIDSNTPKGTYVITYTTPAGGCRNDGTFTITVTDAPDANFTYASKSFCKNGPNPAPIFPAGASAGIFTATPAGLVFVNATTGVIDLKASAVGTYSIRDSIPASGVCAASVSSAVIITIYDLPTLTTSNKSEVCSGTPLNIVLAGTLNSTFSWIATDNVDTKGESLTTQNTPTINDVIFNNTLIPQIVNYTVTLTSSAANGSCAGRGDSIAVTVNPLPKADTTSLSIDTSHCGSMDASITGIVIISGIAPLNYEWVDASGKVVGSDLDLSKVGPGYYILTIKDANGCQTKIGAGKTLNIISVNTVKAAFTMDPEYGEIPLSVNFKNQTTGATGYKWNFGTGDFSTDKDPLYIYTQLGNYTACLVANDENCKDSVCRVVTAFVKTEFVIPNIFTPNNDGFNDIYKVTGKGIGKIQGDIFNRWGQHMYTWNTISGGWDGRSASGVEAPDGSYYYIIEIEGYTDKGVPGKKFIAKGELVLIR